MGLPWYVIFVWTIAAYFATSWVEPDSRQYVAFAVTLVVFHSISYLILRYVFGWRPRRWDQT
jgi:hypothetical protein